MNAILKLKENNFDNKDLVPEVFAADIEGTQILKIATTQNSETLNFHYDVKNICFADEYFMIEGIISNSQEVIGRCVFSINEPQVHTSIS
tara:strand:+ start:353 stop:622 length:270 start_codon:yes stop_codon:yes gene_type:complete